MVGPLPGRALSPTTARRYRQIIDRYLIPRWGMSRINELDISELSAWFRSLHRSGLAPATVRQIRAVFRRALEEAVRWEWIDTNPIKKSTTVPVPRHRLEATEPAMALRLFHAAIDLDESFGVWVYVAATTGGYVATYTAWRSTLKDVGSDHLRHEAPPPSSSRIGALRPPWR